jgi:hypothetical protein
MALAVAFPAAKHDVLEDPPESPSVSGPSRSPAPRWRWRRWLWLLAILVVARIVSGISLAPLAAERLSRVLGTRVDVGDVSFAPLDAVITLRNVVVHAADGGTGADATPPITAGRVRIDVQWLPLLHHLVVVRELALEAARIDLDRLRDDGWTPERFQNLEPARELPPGWSFALERLALRDTQIRPTDVDGGDVAGLDVMVRNARVSTRRERVTAFGRAPNLRVDATVGGSRLLIAGSSDLRDDGVAIEAQVELKDVPLERLDAYRTALAGSSIAGQASGRLHYQRDPGRRDRLTGRLRIRHVAVHVPALTEPALAVRRVDADIDGIDLLQHRITIGNLMLYGACLAVRPSFAAPLPLLDGLALASAERKPARPAPRTTGRAASWLWTIGHLVSPNGRLLVTGEDGQRSLATNVWGESIGPGAYWSPLHAWIAWDAGTAMFDATARMTHGFTLEGRLTASDVDAVAVARAAGPPLATLVQAGRGAVDMNVDLALGDTESAPREMRGKIDPDAPPLDVRGRISVSDLWLAGTDPNVFAFGARSLDLDVARIAPAKDGSASQLAEIAFDGASLDTPYLKLTHGTDGWSTGAPADDPQEAAPAIAFRVDNVRARNGRVWIADESAIPNLSLDLVAVDGTAHALRLPAFDLAELTLQGTDRRLGALRIAGTRSGSLITADLIAPYVNLTAATPYLQRAKLPYGFTSGTGVVRSRLALADTGWTADTTLTLLEPTLGGDEATLERSLGMTPEAAFAALRERHGEIALRLPLASSTWSDGRALNDTVADAVREALARPRLAPPIQIEFAAGRAEPGPAAGRQLATIAEVLATRPDVLVELRGTISRADRRWFAEQEVAAAHRNDAEPGGFQGFLNAVGLRDQPARIRDALAARGAGKAGRLDADDEAALGALVAGVAPIPDEQLTQLAATRSTAIANLLADRPGVVAMRVVVGDPAKQESGAAPVVDARFLPGPEVPQ